MIVGIEGLPGSGKTTYIFGFIFDLLFKQNQERNIYIINCDKVSEKIRDFKNVCIINKNEENEYKEIEELLKSWFTYPQGSIFIIDECTQIPLLRAAGRIPNPPEWLTQFERHRHFGMDFYFVCPDLSKLNYLIRNLIGSHKKVARVFNSPWTFNISSYPGYYDGKSKSAYLLAQRIVSVYKFDKQIWELFESSSLHTDSHKKLQIPKKILIMGIFLIFTFIFAIYSVYSFFIGYKNKTPANKLIASTGLPLQIQKKEEIKEDKGGKKLIIWGEGCGYMKIGNRVLFCECPGFTYFECLDAAGRRNSSTTLHIGKEKKPFPLIAKEN